MKLVVFKVVGFALGTLWILGLLFTSLLVFSSLVDSMLNNFGMYPNFVYYFLVTWFWVTAVAIGTIVASKIWRLVGRWEPVNESKSK